jgi:hypothetical protein
VADNPKYPQNEEWGPLLWRILHTLAEKAGLQRDPLLQADEIRIWPLFVKTLGPMIPCPYCRDHFNEYIAAHPFLYPTDFSQTNNYIRQWFYDFHESVNQRRQKSSFPFANLSSTYKNIGILKETLQKFEVLEFKAMKLNGVTITAWQAWLRNYRTLRGVM